MKMVMILQDNDPHHMHADPFYFYAFFILAPIVVAATVYVGWKLMTYYENRKSRNDEKDSPTGAEKEKKLK